MPCLMQQNSHPGALVANVTSRRMAWLHHWQVDMLSKWHLALAPFIGDKLFSEEALYPVLVETKDKKKALPVTHK